MKIAELFISLGMKIDQFEKGMSDADKAMQKVGKKFEAVGKNLTKYVTLPLLAIGGASIKMAMDAVESENLFEVSMKKMAGSARQWSEKLRDELGLNSYEVRKNVATFNVMLNSMGLGEKAAYDMAKGLTQLAYDMASFYNLKPDEAFQKLQSGISGEIEPLKRLGILVNENTIKHWALTNGLIKQGEQLTEQQKVFARYNVIMEQTRDAQGDLARTLDSPTNKFRILKSRITELSIEFGKILLPTVDKFISILQKMVSAMSKSSNETKEAIVKIGGLAAAIGPVLWGFGILTSKVLPAMKKGFAALTGPIGAMVTLIIILAERVDKFIKSYNKSMSLYRLEADLTGRKTGWFEKTLSSLEVAWQKVGLGVDYNRIALGRYEELQIGARRRADELLKGIGFLNSGLQFLATGFGKLGEKVVAATNAWKKFLEEKDILTIEETEKRINELEKIIKELDWAYKNGHISLVAYTKATKEAKDELSALKGEAKTITTVVETELTPSMRKLGPITYDVIVKMGTYVRGLKEEFVNLSAIFPEKLEPSAINAFEVIKNAQSSLKSHTLTITKKVKDVWTNISEEIKAVWVRELSAIVFEAKNVTDAIVDIFKSMSRMLLDVVFKTLIDGIVAKLKKIKDATIDTTTIMQSAFWSFGAFVTSKLLPQILSSWKATVATMGAAFLATLGPAGIVAGAAALMFAALIKGAKYTGDVISKEMLRIGDAIAKTVKKSSNEFQNLLDIISRLITGAGRIPKGADPQKGLNEYWEDLIRTAKELGMEGSKAFIDLILKMRELGKESKALTEYLLEQLGKIPDALAVLINNASDLGSRFKDLGRLTMLTFDAMIAQGYSYMEALKALQDPLQALKDRYEALGKEVPKFLQPLFDMMEKMKIKPEVFESIDAAITILNSLKNSAYLTQDAFATLAVSARAFAKAIIDDAVGNLNIFMKTMELTKDQINALLPIVSQFVSAAALFGLPIPAWMKSYVTEQLGVDWKEFKRAVADPVIETNKWLNKLWNKAGVQIEWLRDIYNTLKRIGGFQHEGIAWRPQLAMVGERRPEAVVDLEKLARGESRFSGMTSRPSIVVNMNISAMDSQDVYRFMTTKGRTAIEGMFQANFRGITRETKRQMDKY